MKAPPAMKHALLLSFAALLLAPLVRLHAAEPANTAKPNVLLIISDDQGYGDLGCHGNTMIRTPHLDRLHSQSVRFTDFHVDPTCSPTRAALLTGRYSTRTGVWHTVMGRSILFRDEVTLAQVFAANGYRTGIFGKWHLGDNYPARPQDRGFQQALIHGGGGIGQTPDYWGNDYTDDHYLVNGEWRPFQGYCTDVFFTQAMRFIEESKGKPFFVYLPTNVPHGPYRVAERYQKPYLDRGVPQPMASFYGMIENLDENMGRLLEWLRSSGLEGNTILIFMSDNGTAAGMPKAAVAGKGRGKLPSTDPSSPKWEGFNAGMRGAKGSPYEGGHRVPFFIRWPAGGIRGGRDITRLAAHFDVLPTLVELCGLQFTAKNALDGRSLVPLIRSPEAAWPERTLFVHSQREEIPPKWKNSSVMTQRWRLLNGAELYDIEDDPGQARDVTAQHRDLVERLRADYETWWSSLQPAFSRFGCIVIGTPHEDPVSFTCMDWHAPTERDIPWDQPQIDKLPVANGWWMLDVATAGKYTITLRHKPAQASFPLQASKARVKLGEAEVTVPVPVGATSVTVTLELPVGPGRLDTTLVDDATGQSRGAFFVDIARLHP